MGAIPPPISSHGTESEQSDVGIARFEVITSQLNHTQPQVVRGPLWISSPQSVNPLVSGNELMNSRSWSPPLAGSRSGQQRGKIDLAKPKRRPAGICQSPICSLRSDLMLTNPNQYRNSEIHRGRHWPW